MSGLVGVFAPEQDAGFAVLANMFAGLGARGYEPAGLWTDHGAVLGAARHAWEREIAGDGPLLHRDGNLVVAADATLYYRAELAARLGTETGSVPELILAAYRAWGQRCVDHLEGDYAFVVWDLAARRLFCARDFAGTRPLFFSHVDGTLLVSSTLAALQAHPSSSPELNRVFLAETAANLWMSAEDTAYTGASALPAGHSLVWKPGSAPVVSRFWNPRIDDSGNVLSLEDAAAALRHTLARAVAERLGPSVTSVWMSGGRDSTAVFGAGQDALRGGDALRLRPISVSYPPGDPGREDEFITAAARRWNVPVQWLNIGDIPYFDRTVAAYSRDEPYAPLYASFNRALAQASCGLGARVALDGWGGDQLFELSPIYLADLLRSGRWFALARDAHALGVKDLRYLFRMAVTPALPPLLRTAAAWLRGGRPLPDPAEAPLPSWITQQLRRTLIERQQLQMPQRADGAFAAQELSVSLTSATGSRVRGLLSALALEEGVEVRSPLFDKRVIELALARPASERRSGRETKTLLRTAMRGLLPNEVLASRPTRTGTIGGYLRNALRQADPAVWRPVLESSVLADLGIIDPSAFRRAVETATTGNDENQMAALVFTLQTELWLRAPVPPHTDGQQVAVLSPGKQSGSYPHRGGLRCTSNRSSSASDLSGSSHALSWALGPRMQFWAGILSRLVHNSSDTGGGGVVFTPPVHPG